MDERQEIIEWLKKLRSHWTNYALRSGGETAAKFWSDIRMLQRTIELIQKSVPLEQRIREVLENAGTIVTIETSLLQDVLVRLEDQWDDVANKNDWCT